jgi:hypothetical protein
MQDDEYKYAMDAAERVRLQPELGEQTREIFDFLGVYLDAHGGLRDARRGHPVYPASESYARDLTPPQASLTMPAARIQFLLFAAGNTALRYSN